VPATRVKESGFHFIALLKLESAWQVSLMNRVYWRSEECAATLSFEWKFFMFDFCLLMFQM